MLYGSSKRLKMSGKKLNVMYEGNKINFVTQYKYLGTIIDNHLNLNKNFDRAYKRASSRLRLLENLRPYLTLDATMKVYLAMIVPIMTYSSTIRIPCTNTQCKKLQPLDCRANLVTKTTVTPIVSFLNQDICLLGKKCLLKKFDLDIFDKYFQVIEHKKSMRNNNYILYKTAKGETRACSPRLFFHRWQSLQLVAV